MNLIIGRKPVLEALNSNTVIDNVFILYGQQGGIIEVIIIAAKKRGIKCSLVDQAKFSSITTNTNTQGVVAVRTEQKFSSMEEILSKCKQKKLPLILILDSIQDTHNFGAILRTAECAGVDGVIFSKHNNAPINETVVKTSAGAVSHIKLVQVSNIIPTIEELKKNGFWIVGSSLQDSKEIYDVDYNSPIALVVGNEEKGIRKLVLEKCDFLVRIPMLGSIGSLNVSVASGIILFEINRQRKQS